MAHYTTLSREIEAEYEAYLANPEGDTTLLYEKLTIYLKGVIAAHIKKGNYVDWETVEELIQETLLTISERGIDSFEQREARFATYCGTIARNKALDWVRHANRIAWTEWKSEADATWESRNSAEGYGSPEQLLLKRERMLEQIALTKEYLQMFLAWPQKPYRTVGCGFTMILFQKYFPGSRELTSPGWAYGMVKENTVEEGADRFITELQEWFPHMPFSWGADFLDEMDEMEDGTYVSDMVFGEHFQTKDFENWSRRLQPKMKKALLEIQEEKGRRYAAFDL